MKKKYKFITIKEYIEKYSDKKKSQVYKDVKEGITPTIEKYGQKLVRVYF